jgi:hypothetical protein
VAGEVKVVVKVDKVVMEMQVEMAEMEATEPLA